MSGTATEVVEPSEAEMAKRAAKPLNRKVIEEYLARLKSAGTDRDAFESAYSELSEDKSLSAADLSELALGYNKGGKAPSSKKASLALIRARFVEVVRFVKNNEIAARSRPW